MNFLSFWGNILIQLNILKVKYVSFSSTITVSQSFFSFHVTVFNKMKTIWCSFIWSDSLVGQCV